VTEVTKDYKMNEIVFIEMVRGFTVETVPVAYMNEFIDCGWIVLL